MQIWILTLLSIPFTLCYLEDQCPVRLPPFNSKSGAQDIILIDEVYSSSLSNKGSYHNVEYPDYSNKDVNNGHLSVLVYPMDLTGCVRECAIIQRIDTAGRLLTPQIYVTPTRQLHVLIYGYGSGKVFTYDKQLKLYTWQKITVSLKVEGVRVCVSSLFESHCHMLLDAVYEYSPSGPWVAGGTAHRKGMPGFIRDLVLTPGQTHLSDNLDLDLNLNKVLSHFDPKITLPIAETFFLCQAHEIGGIASLDKLGDSHFVSYDTSYKPSTECCSEVDDVIRYSFIKRVVLESALIQSQLGAHLNCTDPDIGRTIRRYLKTRSLGKIGKSLSDLGEELLATPESRCKAVIILVQSSCYGNPEILARLATYLNTGVLLRKQPLLSKEFMKVAAAQRSELANLALAQDSTTCPLKYAYHGVVAEMFMAQWKKGESQDLIAERTRLHHGELGQQDGADDQVFQYLLMQANQGNPEAQANIGRMYYWGQGGVERDVQEAFDMQQAAAQQNHPDGLFDTGIMMLKGHGTDKNTTKARRYLEKAAKAGHKGAPGTLGYLELNENGNVTGAVHYFNMSHNLGDTDATHNLAVIQSYYETFDPDPYYAHNMFKIASERGHKDATLISAEQSLHGIHNKTGNCKEALKYIKILSGQSTIVTRLLREATQTFQAGKYEEAALQYLVLAEVGVEVAQYNLAWLCQEYGHEITTEIPNCIGRYYRMSAQNGHGPSQAFLANELWDRREWYDSARWYAKAANSGAQEGLFGLGFFSKEGIPVGSVLINETRVYFGDRPNSTLTKELWYTCFYKGNEDGVIGCGLPLLLYMITTVSFDIYILILAPASLTILVLSYFLSKLS